MSTKSNDELPSIDSAQLEAVTGGVTTTDSSTTDLTTMMTQMMTSLQDLTQNQSSGSSSMFMEMLPLMMMMRGEQAPQQVVPDLARNIVMLGGINIVEQD